MYLRNNLFVKNSLNVVIKTKISNLVPTYTY